MATLEILSVGVSAPGDLATLEAHPDFRKATRSMILAFNAIDRALQSLRRSSTERPLSLGLTLGACFGELGTTKDFLTSLAERGVARPLLFQNSLYNSIAGFLAIQLKVTGPAFTVSRELRSGVDALELAALLCQTKLCDACLVASVDARVADLDDFFAPSVSGVLEGAACLVVTLPGMAAQVGCEPGLQLELPSANSNGHSPAQPWYEVARTGELLKRPMDNCPLFTVANAIQHGHASGELMFDRTVPQGESLRWRKP
ncbi:MAG TPA: beta-ketoacyl synthase N-terminal-like domain-containing protein [Polyangiaceae bacterium]|nr:beta-ketoacyl synthase N-terminal-like domain-containing protein [Polyangiaceae bacterium]